MQLKFCDRCGKQISSKKIRYYASMYADDKEITPENYVILHGNGIEIDICTNCQDILNKTVANFLESGSKPKKVMGDPEM